MKKTNKPNPLKTFNDNKAMAYKKAGGEMQAFKKSLIKGQNGMAVDSAYKAPQMMEPNPRTNVNIRNAEMIDKLNTVPADNARAKMDYLNKKAIMDQAIKNSKPNSTSVDPSFLDKINLAAKRIDRNVTNRKAVNQLQRSSKVFDSNRSKADALYDKAETTYNKAVDKNKAVNKFKREQGFAPGGDGTYFGQNKYSKPGPIISQQKKGGPVKRKKK
jgi:hypothetical protein